MSTLRANVVVTALTVGTILPATLFPIPASTQSIRSYCASAKETLSHNPQLDAAAKAAFPDAYFSKREDDCIYPYEIFRYGDADALIAIGGKPGEACHGCGANMSAYVLRRTPARSIVVARFVDFASIGSFGNPGQVSALQFAGHDAFTIESGGTFQGYTFSTLTLFLFEAGHLVELKPALPLSADNGGAMTDERKAISVDGSWRVGAVQNEITIDYKVNARGRSRVATATWVFEGSKLVPKSGHVPPEYGAAGGN